VKSRRAHGSIPSGVRGAAIAVLGLPAFWPPTGGCASGETPGRAKSVILFLADAGGLPTLSAASLLGYGAPQKLFVQSWPHVGLMDTSAASEWVTDSAAGMTAIVTGRKTHNGVISQGPDAVYGKKYGEIFLEIFTPRFGDGVDVVLGPGRSEVFEGVRALGKDLDTVARGYGRPVHATLDALAPDVRRGLVVTEGAIDLARAAKTALRALSLNQKGYFLMIESAVHTDDPEAGLGRLVAFDRLIRELAGTVGSDTLMLFTADHSFDFRVYAGGARMPLLQGLPEWKKAHPEPSGGGILRLPFVRMENGHTGEEVVAAGRGPGAERVRGFFPNTDLFRIVMAAYGWTEATSPSPPTSRTP
jgi:alkaline phosphatase